jgi:hypothetical protein
MVIVLRDRRVRLDYGVTDLLPGVEGRTRYDDDGDRLVVELTPQTYMS